MTQSNEKVIVDVDLKESDFQLTNFWFRFGKRSTRLLHLTLLLIGLLLLCQVQLSKVIENPLLATPLTVLIVFPIIYPVLIWFQTKRGFANLKDFQNNVQYAISAGGYKVSDSKSSADINWDTILKAVESKHAFHLFFHKSLFNTIPKRCYRRPEDIDRLRTILKDSLGDKAKVFLPSGAQ